MFSDVKFYNVKKLSTRAWRVKIPSSLNINKYSAMKRDWPAFSVKPILQPIALFLLSRAQSQKYELADK
jgi:hypothetical protein